MNNLSKLAIVGAIGVGTSLAAARHAAADKVGSATESNSYTPISAVTGITVGAVEIRGSVADPSSGRLLGVKPGYRLAVFRLDGKVAADSQLLVSSNGFRFVYQEPSLDNPSTSNLRARQSSAVAFDEDWLIPGDGEWGTFVRRIPRGPVTVRVAVILPDTVQKVRLEIPAALGPAMTLPPI